MAHPAAPAGRNVGYGKPLSQLKTVDDLVKKTEALKRGRDKLERQWKLNMRFYRGDQYSYYPPRSNRLERVPVENAPAHRVRIVTNQIMPGTHTLLAQLTKTKPRLFATPGSGSDKEIKAAQMAESLMDYWWMDMDLDEKLDEALLWSIIASAGYWKITWDPYAAKQMRFLLGPDGQPIVDETVKTEFLSQLAKSGIKPQEKIVYMGDLSVDVMSPFDIFCDNSVRTFADQKYIICRHFLDPDEIEARWKVKVVPNASPATPDETLPFSNAPDALDKTVRGVYIGYFKRTASMPDGRYVVWVDGNDKQILVDEKWPYPHNDLPVVKFPGMRVPGSVYDDAVVTHAIPIQKELNRTVSQIIEYKNLTINPVMKSPVGSLQTRRTTEPGQVLEYLPIGPQGQGPEFEQLPTLPPYVFQHLADIDTRLKSIFLSAEVIEGKVPPNVEAGIAIDLLQEMATDRLAPIIKLIELGLANAGQQMLTLAQKFYIEPRLLKIRGSGGSVQVKQFQGADIAGNISVHADVGSGLPRTRAGRQARVERMVEQGIIPPDKAWKYLDVADLKGLQAGFQADEDLAYRNIDKLIAGQPINVPAMMQAQQQVQSGMNPQTQQPIQSEQEAISIIDQAGLEPLVGINYDAHIDVTTLFMKGVEFEGLPPPLQQRFIDYVNSLITTRISLPVMPEPQAARVTYQIKGTAGPTTSSKILNKAGVPVEVQDETEPPLETWLSDSVDKPDVDQAGPGEEAANLSDAAKTLIEASAADAASKRQQTEAAQKGQLDQAAQAQKMDHAEQLHQQKMKHAEQAHQSAQAESKARAKAAAKAPAPAKGK